MRLLIIILVASLTLVSGKEAYENEVTGKSIDSGEDLVVAVAEDCTDGDQPMMSCIRRKVFSYVNNLLGVHDQYEGRGLSDDALDEAIGRRLTKYVTTHEFRIQLPEFLFGNAVLKARPGRGLDNFDLEFPQEPSDEERSIAAARGILKKKLIFPLLLLLKLKIKALTPILLVLVGIKAIKAFIMSKISFLLVVGFMLLQLFKKGGMQMAMPMPMPAPTEPAPVYGPVPTPSPYGPPAPTPDTSYGPWEPSNGNGNGGVSNGNGNANGPYSRWDAHSLAYSAYQPEGPVKTAQQLKQGL